MIRNEPKERTKIGSRNGLKIFSKLKCKSVLKTKKHINKVSKNRQKELPYWEAVKKETIERAKYQCEIQGEDCVRNYALTPHHITHRSQGGSDEPENIIWGCAECHNHHKYTDGMPISKEQAYQRIGVLPLDYRT